MPPRDMESDKARTRELILDPDRPTYTGGVNWLGHGGRGGRDAIIDFLLLDGATMDRLLQERGTEASIRSHFHSLKTIHDLPVTRDATGRYRFDREHLGIPYGPPTGLIAETPVGADVGAPADEVSYTPDGTDRRELVHRQIRARRGQQQFRDTLRARYDGRCAVSGCRVLAALEAAHINPYRSGDNHDPANGLLLRADVHTLFDLDLLGIHPESLRVELHPDVAAEPGYAAFDGAALRCPDERRPSQAALWVRYRQFRHRLGWPA